MIKNDFCKYTVSNRWILRNDMNFHSTFSLFNIDRRILMNLSPSLYCVVKMLYYHSLSMNDIIDYLARHDIPFNKEELFDVVKEHNVNDLFVESNHPFHFVENEYQKNLIESIVPVSSSPIDVEMHFTHNCNLKCKHCFQESDPHSDTKKHLSAKQWIDIFKQFEQLKMHTIIISGGEPLFYSGFEEVMREVVNYRLSFVFLTNAMLVTPDNIDIFKKKNVQLTISLDGHNADTHELLRGRNTFEKLDGILDFLLDNEVKINIAHTLHKKNYTHLETFIDYLINKGIRSLSIGLIKPSGRAIVNDELLLSKEEERDLYVKIIEMDIAYREKIILNFPDLSFVDKAPDYGDNDYVYCSAGTKRIAISSDGLLYPCIHAFGLSGMEIGDLKKDGILDLWTKNELWEKYRGGITIDQIKICCSCKFRNACALRNCRLDNYTIEDGLYAKPKNCFIDKL